MITARNLTKRFKGKMVLDDLSLEAQAGEVTLLIGSNGAGKTTTLRIMAGSLRADSGWVEVAGVDVARHRLQAQHSLAFLPQSVVFDPRLSCRQVMRFYARLRGVESRRIPPLLALVGLDENADKRTGELSGGLRQRLGLAVLLLPEAPVLLLDEPGLSLDPEWRVTMQEILRRKAAEGACVLVATHLLAEWNGVADRCLSCRDGKVLSEIDPNRLRQERQEGAQ